VVRCLPSLKKLKLAAMEMPELNAFLVGCPILENLNTYLYYEDYANICFPPTLKSLQIDVDIASVTLVLSCMTIRLVLTILTLPKSDSVTLATYKT